MIGFLLHLELIRHFQRSIRLDFGHAILDAPKHEARLIPDELTRPFHHVNLPGIVLPKSELRCQFRVPYDHMPCSLIEVSVTQLLKKLLKCIEVFSILFPVHIEIVFLSLPSCQRFGRRLLNWEVRQYQLIILLSQEIDHLLHLIESLNRPKEILQSRDIMIFCDLKWPAIPLGIDCNHVVLFGELPNFLFSRSILTPLHLIKLCLREKA
jgi:hypothetical protein